ncbi:MAG: SDR family NAD(P)-dependent oxidoreductase [Pyrinomonadaceae bacterium]|nr:SDR family oxidoreductase [Pyrinomonadaceae bacterium]MDQ3584385.1 SDR family oxidoreductase [Acidobacteriota bacterium]
MKTSLITGASSGIGEVFVRRLAARGENVVLVARSEERLQAICNELGRAHANISCQYVALDLSEPDAPERLFAETGRRELKVELLINNAGFGSMGEFTRLDIKRELRMIDLNVKALVELAYLYLKPMRERRRGAIINVASTAAFQPVPFMATYAATKAFVLSFSEALWEENREFGIKVLALCPGVTDTKFFDAAKIDRPPMRYSQSPEVVVDAALRALEKGQSHVISGWPNYVQTQAQRLVPRSFVARIIGKAFRSNLQLTGANVKK